MCAANREERESTLAMFLRSLCKKLREVLACAWVRSKASSGSRHDLLQTVVPCKQNLPAESADYQLEIYLAGIGAVDI